MRDPYYQSILEALEKGDFDPKEFEVAVRGVLGGSFPGLTAVPGGSDGGMDAAAIDRSGDRFFFTVTTARNLDGVKQNLRTSLDSHLQRNDPRRKVVVVTRLELSRRKLDSLQDIARGKGLELLSVIQREDLANRFYNEPGWTRSLLRIEPKLSALSPIPDTRRAFIDIELIGRGPDLQWLLETPGDRLLVGQPGSGKTYLLRQYAKEVEGVWFVMETREETLATAIREKRPQVIVVDDAHASLNTIDKLRHARRELPEELQFAIVATSWVHEEPNVREALQIGSNAVHELPLLTRQEIQELYEHMAVTASAGVMRDLIDQATNKPGLAATLATLRHAGSWSKLATGGGLLDDLIPFLRQWIGESSVETLAIFALGGRSGRTMKEVAAALGSPVPEIRTRVIKLAAAGVLSETHDGLAVTPPQLGAALLAEVFFSGHKTDLDWRELAPGLDDPRYLECITVLVDAAERGAHIPTRLLQELLETTESSIVMPRVQELWTRVARLSPDQARWALNRYPGDTTTLAAAVLWLEPALAWPHLFKAPLEQIHNALDPWLEEFCEPTEALTRRRNLITAAERHLLPSDPEKALQVMTLALWPLQQGSELDPAMGAHVTFYGGYLQTDALRGLQSLWKEVASHLRELSRWQQTVWASLLKALDGARPNERYAPDGSQLEELRRLADRMISDLAVIGADHPGMLNTLHSEAERHDSSLVVATEPRFELFYSRDLGSPGTPPGPEIQRQLEAIGREWATRAPHEIARLLLFYEQENNFFGPDQRLPRWPYALQVTAQEIDDPAHWLRAFLREVLPAAAYEPFMDIDALDERFLDDLLSHPTARYSTAMALLRKDDLPKALHGQAVEVIAPQLFLVQGMFLRGELSEESLRALLQSPIPGVAFEVAEVLLEEKQVAPSLMPLVEAAILATDFDPSNPLGVHGLEMALGRLPHLSRSWLRDRLQLFGDVTDYGRVNLFLSKLLSGMGPDERRSLLADVLDSLELSSALARFVVEQDESFLETIFARHDVDDSTKIALLERHRPDERWAQRAELAAKEGFAPETIARATMGFVFPWGEGSTDHWQSWAEAFERFRDSPSATLSAVAEYGRRIALERAEIGRVEERKTELEGRFRYR